MKIVDIDLDSLGRTDMYNILDIVNKILGW